MLRPAVNRQPGFRRGLVEQSNAENNTPLAGWLAGWLAGCLAGWLPGWLAACLPSWLACRLPAPIGNHPEPSCTIMRKYAVKVDVECATLRRNGQFLYRGPPCVTKNEPNQSHRAESMHFLRSKCMSRSPLCSRLLNFYIPVRPAR